MSPTLVFLLVALAQPPIAIRNVTVISMTDAPPSPGQAVIVRNGRIAKIGPTARVAGG